MERPTLQAMLDAANGIEREGDQYTVSEGHRVSLYVGEPGQGMEVAEVVSVKLTDAFCELTSGEHRATYFVEYSSLHGLSVRAPSGGSGRRAGFS
ncbi:MAG: hypothetical protein AAGF92_08885 [Myxococcota bacterium]